MAIDWNQVGQEQYDRIVEALIYRLYSGIAEVRAVNGRGGDGGLDMVVTQGSRVRIFQLKYFPGGFSGEMRKRRDQITKSFKRAMDHSPYEWTLVVPCNLTPPEKAFVEKLKNGHNVRISMMGRVELDDQISRLPDLVDYFQKDQLLEAAKVYNQEKAILAGGAGDVVNRVHALGKVVDTCDPHWTFDFSRTGGQVTRALRPKHSQAHIVSPIQLNIDLALGKEDTALAEQIRRSLGYGTDEKVILPARSVQNFVIEGPEWLSEESSNVELEWWPSNNPRNEEVRLELRMLSPEGRIVAAHQAKVQHGNAGYEGRCIKATFYGVAELLFLFPYDREQPSTLNYTYSVAGSNSPDLFRAMRLIEELHGEGEGELLLNGHSLGMLVFGRKDSPELAEHLDDVRRWKQLADDLDIVQRHCNIFFPVPDELPGLDRVYLRLARLLIEGKCAIHPTARIMTGTLTGNDSPELRMVLSGKPQGLRLDVSDFTIVIGSHHLRIGDMLLFHTRVVTSNYQEALSALDSGTSEHLVVRFHPEDGEHFRAFLPDKWPDDHTPVVPTPWGLPEFTEPLGSGLEAMVHADAGDPS